MSLTPSGAGAARRPHKPEVAGAIPASATTPEAKALAERERLKRWISDWIKGKK